MKKYVQRVYVAFVAVTALLLFLSGIDFELNVTRRRLDYGYREIVDYDYVQVKDYAAPAGVRDEYTIYLDGIGGSCRELIFYTIHQNVEVYAGDERIYSMRPKHDNFFGKTPGCVWNDVVLAADDAEQPIRILIYPVYKSSIGIVPDFYFGEKYELVRDMIRRDVPAMLLSIVGIVAGIFFIGYILYNYKNSELDKSLAMLGCFSIEVSLWKLTDLAALGIFFPGRPALYLVPLLMLQLVSVPFVLFIKELSSTKENFIWYVPCIASLVVQAMTLGMQILGIRDLRQTLWMTHLVLILTVVVTIFMVGYEVRTMGWNAKLKRNVSFIAICFLGFAIDMVVYYASHGKSATVLGMMGFITYVLAAGAFFMQDAKQLMNIGMKAKNFERMAYHDQLTGLYNRTAYSNYIGDEDFSPERCIVAVFDLNDLKKCNDVLGHQKGDVYIKECADVIRSTFEDVGNCYRMGGDEFCVLMRNISLEQCKQRMQRLREMLKKRNERNPEINMGIACGYEVYDRRIDYDINDTSRRADKMMYREKFSMKEKKV